MTPEGAAGVNFLFAQAGLGLLVCAWQKGVMMTSPHIHKEAGPRPALGLTLLTPEMQAQVNSHSPCSASCSDPMM